MPNVVHIDPALGESYSVLRRFSGVYRLGEGMRVLDPSRAVTITFPPTYEVEDLRGCTVAGHVFVEQDGEYPFWIDFRHPRGGLVAVFAKAEWVQDRPSAAFRAAYKRPRSA